MAYEIDLARTNKYRTRSGKLAEIYTVHQNHCKTYIGGVQGYRCSWRESGGVDDGTCCSNHPNDIVGPWEEEKKAPKVDWSNFPPHFRYLAMDECGIWYGYFNKPQIQGDIWEPSDSCKEDYEIFFIIDGSDEPDFDGDWKDSLCVRPGVEEDAEEEDDEESEW